MILLTSLLYLLPVKSFLCPIQRSHAKLINHRHLYCMIINTIIGKTKSNQRKYSTTLWSLSGVGTPSFNGFARQMRFDYPAAALPRFDFLESAYRLQSL